MIKDGKEMTEKEMIKESLDLLSDACCFLFETESDVGQSLAFMVDSALKYGQVIYRDDRILDAACDYQAYEEEVYKRHMKEKQKALRQ